MSFEPNIGKEIPLETAEKWCENFQKGSKRLEINWAFYGSECINACLGAEGVTGIEMAPAEDEEGNLHIIMMAVNEKGGGVIAMQFGKVCPPNC